MKTVLFSYFYLMGNALSCIFVIVFTSFFIFLMFFGINIIWTIWNPIWLARSIEHWSLIKIVSISYFYIMGNALPCSVNCINIYYYYASGIAQILSDVLNALIIIYSYSLYNYMILLIAFGIFILYLMYFSVLFDT